MAIKREKREREEMAVAGVTKKLATNHTLIDAVRQLEALENGVSLPAPVNATPSIQAASIASNSAQSTSQAGLLSSAVLTSLSALTQKGSLASRSGAQPPAASRATPVGLPGLAGYGSDSD